MKIKSEKDNLNIIALCFAVFGILFAIWTFTGCWPWLHQPYNSYVLQAQSWLSGRLDLAENYSHLEIAVYQGKYYISFPPFPSYLMLPFVLIGWDNPDGFIALVSALAAAVYAYKILGLFNIRNERAILYSLFLTVGSNWLFTAQTAWVWFIAQNLAFTLSLAAIYYALCKKAGISLTLWACAVGCRPLDVMYLPVILCIIYQKSKQETADITVIEIIKAKWKCVIPGAVIAITYMALNYGRFDNPFEFGHNYLPEFMQAQNGQFSLSYIGENLKALIRFPLISFLGPWKYQAFNGTNIFIVSPIFITYIIYSVYAFIKKKADRRFLVIIAIMMTAELIAITAHKTMGGSQFGNRYTNDVLPMAFLGIATSMPKDTKYDRCNAVLLFFALTVNSLGSVLYYLQY